MKRLIYFLTITFLLCSCHFIHNEEEVVGHWAVSFKGYNEANLDTTDNRKYSELLVFNENQFEIINNGPEGTVKIRGKWYIKNNELWLERTNIIGNEVYTPLRFEIIYLLENRFKIDNPGNTIQMVRIDAELAKDWEAKYSVGLKNNK